MRKIIVLQSLIFFLGLSLLTLAACNGQGDAAEEEKEAYEQTVETTLLKIEDDILALRDRADNVLTKDKAAFETQIDSLAHKHDAAEAKLAELKKMSRENWQSHKSEMETLMAELSRLEEETRDW